MDRSFARGARVKPKPQEPTKPLNQELSFPEFMALVGMYVVKDFGVKDRARFLRFCEVAFDSAMRADSASAEQK